jgi:DNA helicase HerA-like ATPase
MDLPPALVAIGILVVTVILLVCWVILLERRISKLLSGKNGSLEYSLVTNQSAIEALSRFRDHAEEQFTQLEARLKKKLNVPRTLRFNPFAGSGTGGNQSFAAAFLDENGDGVIISTLYSREKVSVFAKPIKAHKSEFELSEEEMRVLQGLY